VQPPQPGTTLDHYRILRHLGAGGMGVVYEAEDLKLGRRVALKLIAAKTEADPIAVERFWREARTASALNHPGICTIYEINESEGQPFLVMEMLEGQTLDRTYGGQAVPLPRLIELGVQLADALDAAHRRGILHRDIKPSNIFVTGSGQAKMLDFGLARFEAAAQGDSTDDGTASAQMLTSPGSTLGTIAYMSPEQARGETLDARSDIFSLGVVLYEMSTGKHPFGGTTSAVVFDKLLNYMPTAAISLNHELPPEFESILGKALEKDREMRYQSAADMRADLRRLQRSSSSSRVAAVSTSVAGKSSYSGMTRANSAPAVAATKASPAPAPHAARRGLPLSQPVRLAGLGAAVVLLALAVLWRHVHRTAPAPRAPVTAPAPAVSTPPASVPALATAAAAPTPAAIAKPSADVARQPEERRARSERLRRAATPLPPTEPAAVQPAAIVTPAAVAHPAPAAAPPAPPKPAPTAVVTYAAHHKRFFGRSSSGTLRLSSTVFTYSAGSDSVTLKRSQIRSIDGDTIVETNGKRWRFYIDGMSSDQAHNLLAHWLATGAAPGH
jgi:serine/threonine protein kinase